MMIFGGKDMMRKFGMNSICFHFCTDAYPYAHVLVCYDRMLRRRYYLAFMDFYAQSQLVKSE